MKIVEVILSLTNGGGERFVVDLCNEMSMTQDVTLLVLKDFGIRNNSFYKNEVTDKVKIINLGFKDGFSFSYFFKIKSAINNINPDIVHIHGAADKYCIPIMTFHPRKRVVIQTIHNDIKSSYYDLLHKFIIGFLGILNRIKFVTISKKNHEDFSFYYPRISNELIYNGRSQLSKSPQFDIVKNEINSMKKNESTSVLLHIGRCDTQKNQTLLVKAFNSWKELGANAILLICGSGFDSDLGKELKKISKENIFYIGSKQNVADYLLCCDAFVLSSSYEGMPITVIEAMSLNIPILSTPVCGVVDVVENGINGQISKDFSEESYIQMLNSFDKNKLSLKENCKNKETNIYSITTCSSSYLKLFSRLLVEA